MRNTVGFGEGNTFIFQKKRRIVEREVNPKIGDSYLILKKHSILIWMDTNKRIIIDDAENRQ